jgi:LacI family transcriptional regulator
MAGLIVIPSANSRLVAAADTAGELPVICLDRCPEGWKGDSITVDNAEGAYQATRYLLELGHRRIAAITGQLHVTSAVERLKGFKRAVREFGINLAPEYIQEGRFDRLSGYEKSLMLLQFSPRPTAIFAANDLVALGVLAAMRELGLRCPEEVSLTGFDDLEMASFTNPALTTVAQPAYQMGARAAALLFERLGGENLPAQHIVMRTALKARDSTAAPSRSQ